MFHRPEAISRMPAAIHQLPRKLGEIAEGIVDVHQLVLPVDHNQGQRRICDDGVGEVARIPQLLLAPAGLIDIDQHQHQAVDLVVCGAIGADA